MKFSTYILGLLSLITVPALHAHFYAYQEWYNPKTGQVLESWLDLHEPTNPAINPEQQRDMFIKRAMNNEILVIGEDKESLLAQVDLADHSAQNKQQILQDVDIYLCTTPLSALCSYCFSNDILTVNAECRMQDKKTGALLSLSNYEQEIALYQDSPVFNRFYKSFFKYADHLNATYLFKPDFIKNNFMVDARILHAIHTNQDKHILLAAGAAHIVSIQTVLLQDGWLLQRTVLPDSMAGQEKALISNIITSKSHDHVSVLSDFFENLQPTIDVLSNHQVIIDSILPSKKLALAPRPSYAQFQLRSLLYA